MTGMSMTPNRHTVLFFFLTNQTHVADRGGRKLINGSRVTGDTCDERESHLGRPSSAPIKSPGRPWRHHEKAPAAKAKTTEPIQSLYSRKAQVRGFPFLRAQMKGLIHLGLTLALFYRSSDDEKCVLFGWTSAPHRCPVQLADSRPGCRPKLHVRTFPHCYYIQQRFTMTLLLCLFAQIRNLSITLKLF